MALNAIRNIPAQFTAMLAMLASLAGFARSEWADPAAEALPGNGGPVQRAAQVGTIITVVIIAVVSLVGILILANINSALPAIDNVELDDASDSVLDGFAGAMELVPVVLLVLIAALVIGVVQRMRQQQ